MKLLKQFMIILAVALAGEMFSALIPLPVPGSVYGLVLMLLGLCSRIIPLEAVQIPGRFLIEIMPVMFIPAAVGMMNNWDALRPMLVPVVVIMVVSTFVVMGVTGLVTQSLIRAKARRGGKGEDA